MTEGLKAKLDRFQKIRAAVLNRKEKMELAKLTVDYGVRPLVNLDCSICVRNAMDDVLNYLNRQKETPKLQLSKNLKMVKEPKDMKFHELKAYLKDKGIPFKRTDKKADLIRLANEG